MCNRKISRSVAKKNSAAFLFLARIYLVILIRIVSSVSWSKCEREREHRIFTLYKWFLSLFPPTLYLSCLFSLTTIRNLLLFFLFVCFNFLARIVVNQSLIWYSRSIMSESRCEFILAKNVTSRVFTQVENPLYLFHFTSLHFTFLFFLFIYTFKDRWWLLLLLFESILVWCVTCVNCVYNINMCSRPHIVRLVMRVALMALFNWTLDFWQFNNWFFFWLGGCCRFSSYCCCFGSLSLYQNM